MLGPDAVTDWQPVVRLAEKALAADPKSFHQLNHLRAVLCRAGPFEEGAQRLTDAQAALHASPHDRHIPAVVPGRLVLLVRPVLLLVDDDEPELLERREHGGARADDDVHVTAADEMPLIVPFAFGEATVLNRDAIAEAVAELPRQ